MKTIQPTPSQAAVVLKKYLGEQGISLKLGQAQEAIARVFGYSSWNVLAADTSVRGKSKPVTEVASAAVDASASACDITLVGTCKHCDCQLLQGYCTDDDCPFHHWPQCVSVSDLRCEQSTVEAFYGIRKRDKRHAPPSALPISYFTEQSYLVGADGMDGLKTRLTRELCNTGLLNQWREQYSRGECWFEADAGPFIQVSFDRRMSKRFTTELVFTLRDHELKCYVRTWELKDGLDDSRDYAIFDESSGDFDTDAECPDSQAPLAALVSTAKAEAELHKKRLLEWIAGPV